MTAYKLFEFPPFILDKTNAILWRADQSVAIRPKNLEVLCYLVERHGQLVSKDELLEKVWQSRCVEEAVLKVCINELRQALGDNAHLPRFIATISRRGYRFIAPVTEVRSASAIENICFDAYDRDKAPVRAAYWVNRELAQVELLSAWQIALQGSRQITFITGEAGIGKTTLIEMFLNKVSDCAPNVLRMRCIEHLGHGEALLPLIEAIERRCRRTEGAKLIELLRSRAPTWLAQLPSILQPGEQEILQGAILGAGRERMVREGCELLETLSHNKPLIIIIEDLHWSDNATLDLLSLLSQRSESAPLMVIATYRPGDARLQAHPVLSIHRNLALRGISKEIAISPFSLNEIDNFLSLRFPGIGIPESVNQTLHDRTGGNPLFVTNLVEYLISQYQWSPLLSKLAVNEILPDTTRRVIERELESLSPDEHIILDIASALGVQFSVSAIAAIANKDVITIDRCCDALAKRGQILLPAEGMEKCSDGVVGCYVFRHALYVEVIYSRLAAAEIIRLHLRIGETLEMQYGNKDLKHAASLALHFEKGWDWSRAISYLMLAADNASHRFANYEAHGYLLRALNLIQHLPAAQEAETRITLLKQSAITRRSMGDMQGAYVDLESMLGTARASGNHQAEVLALIQLSDILVWLDRTKCLKQAKEALLCSKNLSDPVLQSVALGIWGGLNLLFGQWQKEYADACHEAMTFARSTENSPILHTRLTQHANVELLASHYRDSWLIAEEAIELSRTLGDGYMFMVDHYFGGLALLHLGEWGKLRRLSEQSIKAFERNNASEPFRLHHEIIMSWLQAEAGDFSSAKICCEKAYADSLAANATFSSIHCLAILGKALVGLGDFGGALKCYEKFFEAERDEALTVNRTYFYPAYEGAAAAWLGLGELDKARDFAQQLQNISLGAPERTYLSLSYKLLAEISMKENDLEKADSHIVQALNIVQNAEVPLATWKVYATAEKLYRLRNKPDLVNDLEYRKQKAISQLVCSLQESDPLLQHLLHISGIKLGSELLTPIQH